MKSVTRHTGTLRILGRLPNSASGCPRFRLSVDGFACVTQPNTSLAYKIENYRDRIVTATIGTYRGKATIDSVELAPEPPTGAIVERICMFARYAPSLVRREWAAYGVRARFAIERAADRARRIA